jgi:hypothetical protein
VHRDRLWQGVARWYETQGAGGHKVPNARSPGGFKKVTVQGARRSGEQVRGSCPGTIPVPVVESNAESAKSQHCYVWISIATRTTTASPGGTPALLCLYRPVDKKGNGSLRMTCSRLRGVFKNRAHAAMHRCQPQNPHACRGGEIARARLHNS